MTKKNPLKELSDMMNANPNLLNDFLTDIDNQISLKKMHIRETRNMMKTMPDMTDRLQQIIDDYQAEIDALVAKMETA
jgi:hypothetical protein